MKESVYLDYNATTPVDAEVQFVIHTAFQEAWQNPSSRYNSGKNSKKIIEEARGQVATLIGALPSEILFTSGGTESNNIVLYSASESKACHRLTDTHSLPHIISTNIEHDSVKLILMHLHKERKIDVTFVPVSKESGKVNPEDVINAVRINTCLITVMLANNETGVIQPVSIIGEQLKKMNKARLSEKLPSIYLHTDAAQALGKINVDVNELGVDFLTIVGHKFYGPRIGALFAKGLHRNSLFLKPLFFGGGQEMSYRPGTENTPLIAGLGKACQLVSDNLDSYSNHMNKINRYLKEKLQETFQGKISFNCSVRDEECLPNTTSVCFTHTDLTGYEILQRAEHIEASTGAACHSTDKPSAVLQASGVSERLAARTLRLSVGRETTEDDISFAIYCLKKAFTSQ